MLDLGNAEQESRWTEGWGERFQLPSAESDKGNVSARAHTSVFLGTSSQNEFMLGARSSQAWSVLSS